MKDYVIIVAGGKGLRMGTDIPKQFLPIGGKPVLMRTIERFREYSKDIQVIITSNDTKGLNRKFVDSAKIFNVIKGKIIEKESDDNGKR